MKKRIISIALVAVMIVAMIPATLLSASALMVNIPNYEVYLHDSEITIDAQKDAIYANSEKIVPKQFADGTKIGFEAYMSATKDALYLYVEVQDPTVGYQYIKGNPEGNKAGNQDKIQLYIANASGTFNNFDLGYYQNNVGGYTYEQDPECPELYFIKGNGIDTSKLEVATNFLVDPEDEFAEPYGWVAEVKIPYTAVNAFGGVNAVGPCAARFVLQVNNDDWIWNGTEYKRSDRHRCFSCICNGDSSWSSFKDQFSAIKYVPATSTLPQYYTQVTTDTIVLDGKLDAVYAKGTNITDKAQFVPGNDVHFSTYTAATLSGLYIWTQVEDTTMNNINDTNAESGDMIQYYIDWTRYDISHEVNLKSGNEYRLNDQLFFGGWVAVDYEGNVAATNDAGSFVKPNVKTAVIKHENPDWDGTDPKTQYIGYTIETFMPWHEDVKLALGQRDADIHVGLGVQVSDDQTYNYEVVPKPEGNDTRTEEQKNSYEFRTAIGYDTSAGGSYYGAYEKLPDLVFAYDKEVPSYDKYVADTVSSVELDGVNTDGEYDNSSKIYVNLGGSGSADAGDYYRVVLADDAIYVLLEVVDNTPCHTPTSNGYTTHSDWYDYIDFAMSFGDVFCGMLNLKRPNGGNPSFVNANTSPARWFNTAEMMNRITAEATDTAEGFTYELKITLTDADKAAIAARTFEFASAAQYQDRSGAETRNYKYSVSRNTSFYLGNDAKGSYIGSFNIFNFTTRNAVETINVKDVSVSLGESIDLNLYATLPLEATDAMVKVTFNEKEYYLNAKMTDKVGEYKFTFENIAPQCLGDVIAADLIVDGKATSLTTDFTVAAYLEGIKAEYAAYADIADALLLYGAAAQKYTNYKADALVADLANLDVADIVNTDKTVDTANDLAQFAAAGVHYANINKIFVKVAAENFDDIVSFQINGVDAELVECADGMYIAYTDAIKATEFGKVYTFELTDVIGSTQTLTYSVNAYAEVMQAKSKNSNTVTLVEGLYNYGVEAAKLAK